MNMTLCKLFGSLCLHRLPHVYYLNSRGVRRDSKNTLRRLKRIQHNPGIESRLQILKDEHPDVEKLEQEEEFDVEDMESDLMGANMSHKEYERERKAASDSLGYAITRSKHFKPPKLPNLLMWSEKEQIRNLHQVDAVEWDPEKLALHFPATPWIIKKLTKSQWKPRSDADIERHDRSVKRNWSDLLQGKFDLDPDFKRHVLSFSSREVTLPQVPSPITKQVVIHNKPRGSTEFSDIVRGYVKSSGKISHLQASAKECSDENEPFEVNISNLAPPKPNGKSCDPQSGSFVIPSRSAQHSRRSELLPLKEYKERVLNVIEEDCNDELSKKYYEHMKKSVVVEEQKREGREVLHAEKGLQLEEKLTMKPSGMLQKYKSPKQGNHNLLPQQLEVFMKAEQYEKKIAIPKDKYDPSAVYKVKDCFYDADGLFLYRVPGLKQ